MITKDEVLVGIEANDGVCVLMTLIRDALELRIRLASPTTDYGTASLKAYIANAVIITTAIEQLVTAEDMITSVQALADSEAVDKSIDSNNEADLSSTSLEASSPDKPSVEIVS